MKELLQAKNKARFPLLISSSLLYLLVGCSIQPVQPAAAAKQSETVVYTPEQGGLLKSGSILRLPFNESAQEIAFELYQEGQGVRCFFVEVQYGYREGKSFKSEGKRVMVTDLLEATGRFQISTIELLTLFEIAVPEEINDQLIQITY